MSTQKSKKENPAPSKAGSVRNDDDFAFGKQNYRLLLICLATIALGYVLMAGGKSNDPNVFNEEIFNFRRITLAPIIVLIGYSIGIYAIVKKAD